MNNTTGEDKAKRASPLHGGVKLERRLPAFYAFFFYAFPAAIAWVWLHHAKPGRSAQLWAPPHWPSALLTGATAGLLIVVLSAFAVRAFPWARALEAEFGWILGAQRKWEVVWIALVSGCAEEYLFRGALQEKFGIWIASAVFAAVHWPVNRNFRPWPFAAGVIGLGLGFLRSWTDSLVAPAAAHVVVNLVNLWRITNKYEAWDEERIHRYVEDGLSLSSSARADSGVARATEDESSARK